MAWSGPWYLYGRRTRTTVRTALETSCVANSYVAIRLRTRTGIDLQRGQPWSDIKDGLKRNQQRASVHLTNDTEQVFAQRQTLAIPRRDAWMLSAVAL